MRPSATACSGEVRRRSLNQTECVPVTLFKERATSRASKPPRSIFEASSPTPPEIGPVAKNVRDCAYLYSILAGRDPRDSTTVELPQPVELPRSDDVKGLRIGVPKELN